jgi:putative transport protein
MDCLFELHKTRPLAHAVGLLACSKTDPPALAFASNIAGADAPTVACATVYPLTTLVRILSAQVLAIALFQ